MNSKDRIKKTINFQGIDRIPCGLFGTYGDYFTGLVEYANCKSVEELFERYEIDIWHTSYCWAYYSGKTYKYKNHKINPWKSLYDEYNPNPPFSGITSVDEVYDFPIPDISEYDLSTYIKEIENHQQFAVCGGLNAAIFHNYLYMCGQLEGLCILKTDPELATAMIDKITNFWEVFLENLLSLIGDKIDIIENCNDFGTQISTFISPEDFRVFFKPAISRLYKIIKRHNIICMQHSCGAVKDIIKDFIEIGADIINPIQVSASGMSLEEINHEYNGEITLYGGIDTQNLLPNGTTMEIQEEVKKVLSIFDKKGGYILSGSQGLMKDIPYKNALAMLDVTLRR